jgi:RNA polymerase sigma-B factor
MSGHENQGGEDADLPELFARAPHDPQAREAIAMRFQPLAEYLARRFVGRGEALEDLVQVADIGLISAIDRFDPHRGYQFASFASSTIVGELKRHFRDKGWSIRVPRQLQETGLLLNRELPILTQELGRSPTIAEVAARLQIDPEQVLESLEAAQAYSTASLDAPAGVTGVAPVDTLGAEDGAFERMEGWAAVAPAIKDLPDRERHVLYLRFFEDMTQSEIAAEIGVSQMHVSRILRQTLDLLRERSSRATE